MCRSNSLYFNQFISLLKLYRAQSSYCHILVSDLLNKICVFKFAQNSEPTVGLIAEQIFIGSLTNPPDEGGDCKTNSPMKEGNEFILSRVWYLSFLAIMISLLS